MNMKTASTILTLALLTSFCHVETSVHACNENDEAPLASQAGPDLTSFLQGIVKPRKNAILRFSKAGIVSKVHVKEGDVVRSGDPLLETENQLELSAVRMAELDAASESAVQKAKLDYQMAKMRYGRIIEAMKRGASTETEVLDKKHALEAAKWNYEEQVEAKKRSEIKLEIARRELNDKTLKAPFEGQVMRIHHRLGNSVDFSTPAVVCADLSVLTVEMNLPAEKYGSLSVGSTRNLFAMVPVSSEIEAKITHVSSEIEPSSQTFRVTFEIDNSTLSLPSGFEVWFSQPKNGSLLAKSKQAN